MSGERGVRSYTRWEDVYGLAVSSVMIAVGAFLLKSAKVTTGGTVGLSLTLSQFVGVPYSVLFIVLNAPLFLLGWRVMGSLFTIKSFAVTAATAVLVAFMPHWIAAIEVKPAFAAVAGGTIVGMGALAAARHGAAAGGTLVVVLWLQRRIGINAGLAQLLLDAAVMLLTIVLLGGMAGLWSAVGIVSTDAMIMAWHRPNRRASDDEMPRVP